MILLSKNRTLFIQSLTAAGLNTEKLFAILVERVVQLKKKSAMKFGQKRIEYFLSENLKLLNTEWK